LYSGDGNIEEGLVRHLYRVVSGLESGLVGETSIQGQVKSAYLLACGLHKLSGSIHKLFQSALRVGKLVRTQTGLSRGAMSHSQAVVDIMRQRLSQFSDLNITILGVHNMNGNLLHHLTRRGAKTVFVGNRTFHKASELASKYNVSAFDFSMLESRLKETDVLISATSAPHAMITSKIFPANKPMMIFDLAMPHDVESEIGLLPGVDLYNVTQIESAVEQNLLRRQAAIGAAELLVEEQIQEFMVYQTKRLSDDRLLKAV
jgi:glutamyl-tRNA reductase